MPDKVMLKTRVDMGNETMVADQLGIGDVAEQMRTKFTVLQKLAQTTDNLVTNNRAFELNVAKLLYKASQKVYEPLIDDENGYKKELPDAFIDMLKSGQIDEVLLYQTLSNITADMLDGAVVFNDQAMALKVDAMQPPFVLSDVLVDLANVLDRMKTQVADGVTPKIEFWLEAVPADPATDFEEDEDLMF